jgi:hypothetical protein
MRFVRCLIQLAGIFLTAQLFLALLGEDGPRPPRVTRPRRAQSRRPSAQQPVHSSLCTAACAQQTAVTLLRSRHWSAHASAEQTLERGLWRAAGVKTTILPNFGAAKICGYSEATCEAKMCTPSPPRTNWTRISPLRRTNRTCISPPRRPQTPGTRRPDERQARRRATSGRPCRRPKGSTRARGTRRRRAAR